MIYLTSPDAFGIFLSTIRKEKKYHSKWLVESQPSYLVAIRKAVPSTYGLFLRESKIVYKNKLEQRFSVYVLLVGSDEVFVPVEFLTEVKEDVIQT
jgi:hypothetical protein